MCFLFFNSKTAVTFPLLLFMLQLSRAQTPELKSKVNSYLEYLKSEKSFSGEVLISKDCNIIFHGAIGEASRELKAPITVGTKFKIASITKTFTGSLIAMAEQDGLLSTSDLVRKYLKTLSTKFENITIHQLLTHTSGIPHNAAIANYWQEKSRLNLETSAVITEINKLDLLFTPGKEMQYSSLGYYLLSTILEVVYELTYQEILEKKIYKKIDMNETGSANSLAITQNMASGYHLLPNDSLVVAPYRNYSMLKGAGDQYSTAEDLLKWNCSFQKNTLLSKGEQSEVFNEGNETFSYGYGWYTNHNIPRTKYYHGGGTWGFSSHIAYYPEEGLSIILLSNVSTLPVSSMALQLERIIFGEAVDIPKVTEIAKNSALPLAQYVGAYLSTSGQMEFIIVLQKTQLFAQLQGNPPFLISPLGGNKFLGKKIDIELEFKTIEDQVIGIVAERMGSKFQFKKQ